MSCKFFKRIFICRDLIFMGSEIANVNKITPKPSANAKFPLLVSSAIAVVITLVTWSMLPPTIITAPTSALARPNPAKTAVVTLNLPSQSKVFVFCHPVEPIELKYSAVNGSRE